MSAVYFESSALVKLAVREPGSAVARSMWRDADGVVSSLLSYPEVRAALAAARRAGRLGRKGLDRAKTVFEVRWLHARKVSPTAAIVRVAGELAERYGLTGYDAVHLASALTLVEDGVIAVSWDERFRRAATRAGLRLAPAALRATSR